MDARVEHTGPVGERPAEEVNAEPILKSKQHEHETAPETQ
jgi:hypothetical protein